MARKTPEQKDAELSGLYAKREQLGSAGFRSNPRDVSRLEYLQRDKAARSDYGERGYSAAMRSRAAGQPAPSDSRAQPHNQQVFRYPGGTTLVQTTVNGAGWGTLQRHVDKLPGDTPVRIRVDVTAFAGEQRTVVVVVPASQLQGPGGITGGAVAAVASHYIGGEWDEADLEGMSLEYGEGVE